MLCLLSDTDVITQGDEAHHAYIMIQGTASVTVTMQYKDTFSSGGKIKQKTKQMSDIGNRCLFGEIALMFQSRRTATVRTQESCHVIQIEKDTFNRYIRGPLLKKLTGILQYYKTLSFFENVQMSTLLILASKTVVNKLQAQTLIIR